MDNSFPQQGSSGTQQSRGSFGSLQIFGRIPYWLTRLFQLTELTEEEKREAGIYRRQLTEEEQKDAGFYLDDQRLE